VRVGLRVVQQDHVPQFVDPEIGDHPALRRQIGRIAPLARLQSGDVVGEQTMEIGRSILARHDDKATIGAVEERRTPAGRIVSGRAGYARCGRNQDVIL